MKYCIVIAFALVLLSCNDESVSSTAIKTVHLAGVMNNSACDGGEVSYWKDGDYTLVDPGTCSLISSFDVDGTSVYIGGSRYIPGSPSEAMVWKDGVGTVLDGVFGRPLLISQDNNLFGVWLDLGFAKWVYSDRGNRQPIIDTASDIWPTGIALLGDDVFVSGSSVFQDATPDSPSYLHAQCWKDGQLIFREDELSHATSIFIDHNDIYMAGYIGSWPDVTACYWKNGQRTDLTENATATSIFFTDGNVYVSGSINDQAVYWKNGTPITLSPVGTSSTANSIFVQGNDVHVGGHQDGYPAYWKNSVRENIENQDKLGQIKFVIVGSN